MRTLIIIITLLFIAGLAGRVKADDYLVGSLGLFANSKPSLANVKYGELGHREYLPRGFYFQVNGGAWIQTAAGDGRKSSGFVSGQLGIEAENAVVLRVAVGPAIISSPDSYLGGIFQFKDEFFIGLKGKRYNTIGIRYTHFSSAGLETPNKGRDFGGVEVDLNF